MEYTILILVIVGLIVYVYSFFKASDYATQRLNNKMKVVSILLEQRIADFGGSVIDVYDTKGLDMGPFNRFGTEIGAIRIYKFSPDNDIFVKRITWKDYEKKRHVSWAKIQVSELSIRSFRNLFRGKGQSLEKIVKGIETVEDLARDIHIEWVDE